MEKNKEKIKRNVSGVSRIIVVASGKGGVGKSTVAANLAIELSNNGFTVGLLDADVYGPSIPIMFGINSKAKLDGNLIIPEQKYSIKISSIGFLVDPEVAVVWRGPMITKMLYQLLSMTRWTDLGEKNIDFLIVDTPPGTGDMHLSLAENYKIDGAIIISTPQGLALADAVKAVDMFSKLNIPIIGIVENMSYFQNNNDDSAIKHYIFGCEGVLKYSRKKNIPYLGSIPISQEIAESSEFGAPISHSRPGNCDKVLEAFNNIAKEVIASTH